MGRTERWGLDDEHPPPPRIVPACRSVQPSHTRPSHPLFPARSSKRDTVAAIVLLLVVVARDGYGPTAIHFEDEGGHGSVAHQRCDAVRGPQLTLGRAGTKNRDHLIRQTHQGPEPARRSPERNAVQRSPRPLRLQLFEVGSRSHACGRRRAQDSVRSILDLDSHTPSTMSVRGDHTPPTVHSHLHSPEHALERREAPRIDVCDGARVKRVAWNHAGAMVTA